MVCNFRLAKKYMLPIYVFNIQGVLQNTTLIIVSPGAMAYTYCSRDDHSRDPRPRKLAA